MKRSHLLLTRSPTLTLLVALAACGGGGDDDTSGTTPKAINAQNGAAVAARGYDSAIGLIDASDVARTGLEPKSSSSSVRVEPTRFALDRLRAALAGQPGYGLAATGVVTKALNTTEFPCGQSGTLVVTEDDANGNGRIDPGESVRFAFSGCASGGGTVSGGMTMTLVSASATPSAGSASASFVFADLLVVGPGFPATGANGDLTVSLSYASSPSPRAELTATGNRLTLIEGSETQMLTGYAIRGVYGSIGDYAYTLSGNVSGSGIPGTLAMTTPVPIAGVSPDPATSGVLVLAAADGSTVRVVVTPPSGVVASVDENGDGTPESTQSLTWAQVAAL